jgi:hypothetical protein
MALTIPLYLLVRQLRQATRAVTQINEDSLQSLVTDTNENVVPNLVANVTALTSAVDNITGNVNVSVSISWTISSSGTSDYVFSGPGITADNTNDPALYLYKGFTYTFVNTTESSHPFAIRESNGGANYTSGVSGSQTGTQTFTVPMNAPSTLYYQCTLHSNMGNVIYIV